MQNKLSAVLVLAAVGLAVAHPERARHSDVNRILPLFEADVHALAAAIDTLGRTGSAASFRAARLAYKRPEVLLEFYAPALVLPLNGPSPDADPDLPPPPPGSPSAFERAFSAMESGSPADRKRLATECASMARIVRGFERNMHLLNISDSALFDAARLEMARVSTLGMAAFDAPNVADSFDEEAAAIEGMREFFRAGPQSPAVDSQLAPAAAALRTHRAFNDFNRLAFIVAFANPAAQAIAMARSTAGIGAPKLRRSWRPAAASVFDANAFDASAYAPEFAKDSPAMVALGRKLFFDARLSGPGTRSCSSCHIPERAFTDGMARPATLEPGQRAMARNTPTVVNAALQPALFADQRAASLEDQIKRVLLSDAEMRSSPELAGKRVNEPPLTVRIALAAYLRTLVSIDSRADRALRGDTLALSRFERAGFNLYMGKARCATCHYLPLTTGTVPPHFDDSELEIIGVPSRPVTHGAVIDPDSGRERVDHAVEDRYAFRVPSLRNVALTAPYMHNGAYATLDQVIDFYDRGGGRGIGAKVPGQTLPDTRLGLTPTEKSALVAFLRALTDSTPIVRERSFRNAAK
jgi:cytochrome c peroxidase